MLIEGPPGTSKSTLLSAITLEWGVPLVFVEGNADLTPSRLIGHHNPARVLREDYSADNFVDGPLLEAMREGGFLYIEELNRAPEDTLNTLLTAMAEREVAVPRVDALLRIPARGLTNISFPLQVARRQLARIPARDARVLLLSDCVHNAGPDPRLATAGLARIDVLLDASGEHDEELARDLARLGHGRLARVRGYRDVAPAVSGLFAR